MRRIRSCTCFGIRGRLGRDFRRQNSLQPARCQRIIVSGRTTTRASRQLKNLESTAREIRVTGSIRRGLTPHSTNKASRRRRNRFSAWIDCDERNARRHQRSVSRISWTRIPETIGIVQSCHTANRFRFRCWINQRFRFIPEHRWADTHASVFTSPNAQILDLILKIRCTSGSLFDA